MQTAYLSELNLHVYTMSNDVVEHCFSHKTAKIQAEDMTVMQLQYAVFGHDVVGAQQLKLRLELH